MGIAEQEIHVLEQQLDDFELQTRTEALQALSGLADAGEIRTRTTREIANLHCHSFFSYNGYGYSPSHLAWIARKHGIKFMGVVDFDVLDAVDEFLDACETANVRGIAGIETRVFVPQFKDVEINSPGEPGICYHMGTGFTTSKVSPESRAILADINLRASERNRDMLKRINAFLAPLSIDYSSDVLPLTPAGNATERHILQVLVEKAKMTFKHPAGFWAGKLKMPVDELEEWMQDKNKFKNLLRAKLMKRGGVGYTPPSPASFPTTTEFHSVMESAGALPCSAWLDGTSQGEQRIEELLDLMIMEGVAAINIVPDRNWNIKDPQEKMEKLDHLYAIVDLAERWDLPVLVGTEMNKFGQKMVDDFDVPELGPVADIFMKGAEIIYGHTQLQRYWRIGYQSAWANMHFSSRKNKNEFYLQAGRALLPGQIDASDEMGKNSPDAVLNYINTTKEKNND